MSKLRFGSAAAILGGLMALGILAPRVAASMSAPPVPVSPAAGSGRTLVEARCPTFSFAGVEGARGYELVIFLVPAGSEEALEEPRAVVRATLPAQSRGWTPSLGQCLEPGGRYAWSLRAVTGDGEGPWSEPAVFHVASGPTLQEVEAALETLRRHRMSVAELTEPEPLRPAPQSVEGLEKRLSEAKDTRAAARRNPARAPARPADLPAEKGETLPELAFAAAPVLSSPSLAVSANIALGAESNLFKDGQVLLWDDAAGNTALGRHALAEATSDTTNNTALGREALAKATGTASENTAVGRRALQNTTAGVNAFDGSRNTAVGDRALQSNTTGARNTATGEYALQANTSGSVNTAHGARALRDNDTGTHNTAIGISALQGNTTGFENTASGASALISNNGIRNTATGASSLLLNTTGNWNTASGAFALRSNESGLLNTANGADALFSNISGHDNTASGADALFSNTTGQGNTASGRLALESNTTGSRNVALGLRAGYNLGYDVSDPPLTTMSDNLYIANEGEPDEESTIRIGNQDAESELGTHTRAFIAGIHQATLTGGNEHPVCVDEAGQLGLCTPSSLRFKVQVVPLGERSSELLELRPVSFRYRDGILGGPEQPRIGLIAEEVAERFPELVFRDHQGRLLGVRYDLLSVVLLAELQQERLRNGTQRSEMAALRQRVTALEADAPAGSSATVPWWRRRGAARDLP